MTRSAQLPAGVGGAVLVVGKACELGGALVVVVGGELPLQPEPSTAAANPVASSAEPRLVHPISALSLPAIG